MPLFRSGVSNFRIKGYKGKRSIQTISQKSDKHMKGISTINFGKIATGILARQLDNFILFFE